MATQRAVLKRNENGSYDEVLPLKPREQARAALKRAGELVTGVDMCVVRMETPWMHATAETVTTVTLVPVEADAHND